MQAGAKPSVFSSDVGCPSCGHTNPIDVKFCQKCGGDLSSLFAKCPKCQRENRKDIEFCGGCGLNLKGIETFWSEFNARKETITPTEAIAVLQTAQEKFPFDKKIEQEYKQFMAIEKRILDFISKAKKALEERDFLLILSLYDDKDLYLKEDTEVSEIINRAEKFKEEARLDWKDYIDKQYEKPLDAIEHLERLQKKYPLETKYEKEIKKFKEADESIARFAKEAKPALDRGNYFVVLQKYEALSTYEQKDIEVQKLRQQAERLKEQHLADWEKYNITQSGKPVLLKELQEKYSWDDNIKAAVKEQERLQISSKSKKTVVVCLIALIALVLAETTLNKKQSPTPSSPSHSMPTTTPWQHPPSAPTRTTETAPRQQTTPSPAPSTQTTRTRLPAGLTAVSNASYAPLAGLASGSEQAQEHQRAAAEATGLPQEVECEKTGMRFRLIPAGEFVMGSPSSEANHESDESPQRTVNLTQPFYMGIYEVTQAEYQKVMGTNPSKWKGDNLPVEKVSWNDATEFCKRMSEQTGLKISLPTEAQWEYACRAGTTTPFNFGGTISTDQANYDGHYVYGNGRKGVYRQKTTSVGSFAPNAFGLYDMHGNVWEWCQDGYQDSYNGLTNTDPQGPQSDSSRVLRGGSWLYGPDYCRAANRSWNAPVDRSTNDGFRVVCLDF